MLGIKRKREQTTAHAWKRGRSALGHGVSHLRRNTVAYLALMTALGGTSYAATQLPTTDH